MGGTSNHDSNCCSTTFGHLEKATAHFSGTWSASLAKLPVIEGIEGYDGCGYIRVLGVALAANIIQTGFPSEGGPSCSVKFY